MQASYDTTPSTHIKGGFGRCSPVNPINAGRLSMPFRNMIKQQLVKGDLDPTRWEVSSLIPASAMNGHSVI